MIVIAGIPSEPPIALAIDAAQRLGIEHVVVNQRHVGRMEISCSVDGSGARGHLEVEGRHVDLADVAGIYWRLMEPSALPEAGQDVPRQQRERVLAACAALETWIDSAPCRVANRIGPMGSNFSKPYQALLIERAGFPAPPTIITNRPAAVEQAAAQWGPLVYKSASSVRSIVRPLDQRARGRLEQVRWLPTQFQAEVPGTDVRVHVVGEEVFATEVRSDAVDYRYATRDGLETELEPTDLPQDVADRCRRLAVELDLPFCGIDLRRDPQGRWWCFEVNPSPGYSYYQGQTGQPISDALVRWLDTRPA